MEIDEAMVLAFDGLVQMVEDWRVDSLFSASFEEEGLSEGFVMEKLDVFLHLSELMRIIVIHEEFLVVEGKDFILKALRGVKYVVHFQNCLFPVDLVQRAEWKEAAFGLQDQV